MRLCFPEGVCWNFCISELHSGLLAVIISISGINIFFDLCSDVKFDVSYALVLDYSIAYVEVSVEAYCIVSNYDHVFLCE